MPARSGSGERPPPELQTASYHGESEFQSLLVIKTLIPSQGPTLTTLSKPGPHKGPTSSGVRASTYGPRGHEHSVHNTEQTPEARKSVVPW